MRLESNTKQKSHSGRHRLQFQAAFGIVGDQKSTSRKAGLRNGPISMASRYSTQTQILTRNLLRLCVCVRVSSRTGGKQESLRPDSSAGDLGETLGFLASGFEAQRVIHLVVIYLGGMGLHCLPTR